MNNKKRERTNLLQTDVAEKSDKDRAREEMRVLLCPENLLEDILRAHSLNCDLEELGYPHFLVKLYRRALHSRGVLHQA